VGFFEFRGGFTSSTIAPYSQNLQQSTMDAIPPDAPAPRLCHVIKRPDFEGFGFNLFAGKVKTGQFIGKVDAGSPAEDAGLKPGDRIIEVNGVHIGVENHKQVKIWEKKGKKFVKTIM
jgi:C-terminal processing protease CtpA/Prc